MLRTLLIGALAFCLTFIAGWFLGLGRTTSTVEAAQPKQVEQPKQAQQPTLVPLEPKLAAFRREAAVPPKPAPGEVLGKGLTDNDGLRQQVILRAKAHERPVCNADSKSLYITAATRYAEVLMRSAGCNNFPKCPMGEGNLGDVWRLNRNAADAAVAEAMAKLHALGGIGEKDFRADVGRAVRVIAGRDFNTAPGPQCEHQSSHGGRWSVRIRR
jgi:hypothetical protein